MCQIDQNPELLIQMYGIMLETVYIGFCSWVGSRVVNEPRFVKLELGSCLNEPSLVFY